LASTSGRPYARDSRNEERNKKLEAVNAWRNAIAHQQFDPTKLGGRTTLVLATIEAWRRTCNALAREFDRLLSDHLRAVVGVTPW